MPTATADPVIRVGSSPIRIQDVLAVASGAARIALDDSPAFTKKVEASAALLEKLIGQQAQVAVTLCIAKRPELSSGLRRPLMVQRSTSPGRRLRASASSTRPAL